MINNFDQMWEKMQAEFEKTNNKMDDEFGKVYSKIDDESSKLNTKIDEGFAKMDQRFTKIEDKLDIITNTNLAQILNVVTETRKELKEAKEIHKEEPFYINLPAKDIFDEAADNEMILVQGIIDLYYIDKNGNLILVDYKTDYVPDGNLSKLEEKYKIQLELYKKALEGALGRKVDKAMIWALNN